MIESSLSILLVESKSDEEAVIKKQLQEAGDLSFCLVSAADLDAAKAYLDSHRICAVLLDAALLDSQDEEKRKNLGDLCGRVPVIVYGGRSNTDAAHDAMSLGVQDYLVKGEFGGKTLSRSIRHAVERQGVREALQYQVNLEKLIATQSTLFLSLNNDQLEQALLQSLAELGTFLDADGVQLTLFSGLEKNGRGLYSWESEAASLGASSSASACPSSQPWIYGKMRVVETVSLSRDRLPPEAQKEIDDFSSRKILSFVRVPLIYRGALEGCLGIDFKRQVRVWPEKVLTLFKILGEIYVIAHHRILMESQLQKLSLAVEQSPSIVMITDADGRIEYVNPKFTEVTGYALKEILGKSPGFLKSGKTPDVEFKNLWKTIKSGKEWQGEFVNRKKNGELFWERCVISSIKNSEGVITNFLAVKEDITKRKWAEETIQHMAYYDPLTDLPNRMLFNDRLGQALAQAKRKGLMAGILFLDLDRFKVINDTLGHTLGDMLLRAVGARLKNFAREGDTIARMGGDEFALLLTGITQVDDAVKAAQGILDILNPPFMIESHEVHITPSIGISIFPYDGADGVTLVKNADAALNRAKEQGRTNYQLYTPVMNAKAFERMTLQNSLRKALDRGEFTLYYQPQVSLVTGDIVGMEALLRWEHPDLGLVSPAQFIPMAEETGLIVPIGEWVLRTACEQNKKWQTMGYRPMVMAVNLSARQFNELNLVAMVSGILKSTQLEPQWLDLEITESIIMQHLESTIATLRDLHHLGIQISIDDFGTGYSSLTYLKKFPVHALKIDQSFIREITTDPDDAAITAAVIAMGHSLKLNVIAEGVETNEQLQMLKNLKCDRMQGYLFSRPVPEKTITPLIMEGWRLKTSGQLT